MKGQLKLAAAFLFLSGVTFPAFTQSQESEEVTVFAPYVVKKTSVGPPRERVTTITMSRAVGFGDLDLKGEAGAGTLESRVKQAAQDLCKEFDRRYPEALYQPVSANKNCARQAESQAMAQVQGVLAAARG